MISFGTRSSGCSRPRGPLGAERVRARSSRGARARRGRGRARRDAGVRSQLDGWLRACARATLAGDGPWRAARRRRERGGRRAARCSRRGRRAASSRARGCPTARTRSSRRRTSSARGDAHHLPRAPRRPAAWVRRRGEDLADGRVALARGTRLPPGRVALAAALDRPSSARRAAAGRHASSAPATSCARPASRAPPGSIAESNGVLRRAPRARRGRHRARRAVRARRPRPRAERAVAEALRGSDLVVTIGGVSVGDRDVMRPALEAAGVVLDFWRVTIKPGKPLAVGRAGSDARARPARATRRRRRSRSCSSACRSCARCRATRRPCPRASRSSVERLARARARPRGVLARAARSVGGARARADPAEPGLRRGDELRRGRRARGGAGGARRASTRASVLEVIRARRVLTRASAIARAP